MTLNLRIVLAIIGVIVVVAIYLVSRWQNRARHRRPKAGRARGNPLVRDFPRNEPAMGDPALYRRGEEFPGESGGEFGEEIPVLEKPIHSGERLADDGDENEWRPTDAPPRSDADAGAVETTPASVPRTEPPVADLPKSPAGDARAPVFIPTPTPEPQSADPLEHPVEGFARLSQIDYWVKITGGRDVGRETVLALYRDGVADFRKTHGIHGIKLPEREWRDVESESEDSRFADLVVTIQLADHNGSVSEQELAGFSRLVSRLSEGTGREFVFMTPVENAIAQANAIAEFTHRFNSVFTVNVRPPEGETFSGADIDRYALQIGLERDGDRYYSRFKSVGGGRAALYSLADLSDRGHFDFDNMKLFSTRGLTLFTRPAVNRLPGAVFSEMVDAAKAFASRIQGEVNLPDNGEFSQDQVDRTRHSIERMAAEMERLGIAAGSDEAARIF